MRQCRRFHTERSGCLQRQPVSHDASLSIHSTSFSAHCWNADSTGGTIGSLRTLREDLLARLEAPWMETVFSSDFQRRIEDAAHNPNPYKMLLVAVCEQGAVCRILATRPTPI